MTRKLPSIRPASAIVCSPADLGLLVRNARSRAGLRIDDAAAYAGLSADTLSRMERGRPVTTDRLLTMLDALGLALIVAPKAQALAWTQAHPGDSRLPDTCPDTSAAKPDVPGEPSR